MRRSSRTIWILVVLVGTGLFGAGTLRGADILIYGFEGSLEGWAIPDWAKMSSDYVGRDLKVSGEQANEGSHSLQLDAAFPGERWTGAYVERELEVIDWSLFGRLAVNVYLPAYAPKGLEGKIVLTVGDKWEWTEMNRTVSLAPGAWTTIAVSLKPGSMDWRFFPDEQFRSSVRKLGVRIESNRGPEYTGPVFIDNVYLAE